MVMPLVAAYKAGGDDVRDEARAGRGSSDVVCFAWLILTFVGLEKIDFSISL